MTEDEISYQIISAAIEAHRTLGGPGLLESVYEEALVWELKQHGLVVERQKTLPIHLQRQYAGDALEDRCAGRKSCDRRVQSNSRI